MDRGKGYPLQVKDFYQKIKGVLKLTTAPGKVGFSRKLAIQASRKGTLDIQVWGKREWEKFRRLPGEQKKLRLKTREKAKACLVLAEGLPLPLELAREVKKTGMAVFLTSLSAKKCREEIRRAALAAGWEQVIVPGGLLRIFNLGVLIVGDSGIGKSESALELVSRGYKFVSDDVALVEKKTDGRLIGKAPPLSRNFMEIRGLGIIDIRKIFGASAISQQSPIDLVIQLKRWEEGREYDRLGLKFPEDYEIMGEKIPQISIPVAPGRNISTLIEVACKVYLCRKDGYQAPKEMLKRLDRAFSIR